MLSHIYSCGLSGIDGFSVCVETDISNGLPAFDTVSYTHLRAHET